MKHGGQNKRLKIANLNAESLKVQQDQMACLEAPVIIAASLELGLTAEDFGHTFFEVFVELWHGHQEGENNR